MLTRSQGGYAFSENYNRRDAIAQAVGTWTSRMIQEVQIWNLEPITIFVSERCSIAEVTKNCSMTESSQTCTGLPTLHNSFVLLQLFNKQTSDTRKDV